MNKEFIDELIKLLETKKLKNIEAFDLCDKSETEKFVKFYEDKGYRVLKYDLNTKTKFDDLYDVSNELLKEKYEKLQNKGITKKNIRALVIGIPNEVNQH